MPVGGSGAPVPVAAGPFGELNPTLSPDGHWLAYTSDESGAGEVYVRPFPNANGGRWQISNGGGGEPRWSHTGRELFYIDATQHLVAVQVRTVPSFAAAGGTALCDVSGFIVQGFHQSYDITPDDKSFMFVSPKVTGAGPLQIVWVDHWFTDLAARLAH